ncbi:GATS protein-like 3 [Balamuthia mandrillaris]
MEDYGEEVERRLQTRNIRVPRLSVKGVEDMTSWSSPTGLLLASDSPPTSASPQFTLTYESISTLPQKLFLASIQRENVNECFRAILQLAFFPVSSTSFFSYTETEDEISVLVDEHSLSLFPEDAIVLCPPARRAIQVYEGAEAINMTGYISLLAGAIASAGISIIYLSTFNTDLIVVAEEHLEEAHECLKKALQPSGIPHDAQKLFQSSPQNSQLPTTSPPSLSSIVAEGVRDHRIKANKVNKKNRSDGGNRRNLVGKDKVLVSPLPKQLSIATLPREALSKVVHPLLRVFLMQCTFFSVTMTKDEVSMIIDDELLEYFDMDLLEVHDKTWRGIQVEQGSMGTAETGAVSMLADVWANEGISIYYLSTFQTDFVLVEEEQLQEAIQVLLQENLAMLEDEG